MWRLQFRLLPYSDFSCVSWAIFKYKNFSNAYLKMPQWNCIFYLNWPLWFSGFLFCLSIYFCFYFLFCFWFCAGDFIYILWNSELYLNMCFVVIHQQNICSLHRGLFFFSGLTCLLCYQLLKYKICLFTDQHMLVIISILKHNNCASVFFSCKYSAMYIVWTLAVLLSHFSSNQHPSCTL
jgi:hypothetical protein